MEQCRPEFVSSPSFPKWGFGNAPFRAQFHCVAGGGSGAAFLDQPLTAKHSFPAMLAFPNPQFVNEGAASASAPAPKADQP